MLHICFIRSQAGQKTGCSFFTALLFFTGQLVVNKKCFGRVLIKNGPAPPLLTKLS